jgi:shikimate dehydrogenase
MITSTTKHIALLGLPIDHSRSPEMINDAFRYMNVNCIYTAFNVMSRDLHRAVDGLKVLGFKGWNVTIPYKVKVIEYLDELDEMSREMGAVNTVVNKNGKYIGYNTDGMGYLRSLLEETNIKLHSQRVVILGAGGAARSVGFSLAKAGVEKITIANRTVPKGEALAQQLSPFTRTNAVSIQASNREIMDATLVINTTSVGMHPNVGNMPIDSKCLHSGLLVSDLVYNPRETALLHAANERGAMIHHGVGMLIYQAAIAIELWTGKIAPVHVMRKALEESMLKP